MLLPGQFGGQLGAAFGLWHNSMLTRWILHRPRVWDGVRGAPVGEPLTGHTGWMTAVAVGELDGVARIVLGSHDRTGADGVG